VKKVAKPPVDPADVLAAADSPRLLIANMPTMNLIALVCTKAPEHVSKLAREEFKRRLSREKTPELLSGSWLVNASGQTMAQIVDEYIKRPDARGKGVVHLYGCMKSAGLDSEHSRRDVLRTLFKIEAEDEIRRGQPYWFTPVTNTLTANHIAELYDIELDEREEINRCWLASHYGQFVGAKFDFLFKAYTSNRFIFVGECQKTVSSHLRAFLPILTDSELREYVEEAITNPSMFEMLIGECKRRRTFRPADYRKWANRLSRDSRGRRDVLRDALKNCYTRMPMDKLIQIARHPRESIHLLAIQDVLGARLGEATSEQLIELHNKLPTLRMKIARLYGQLPVSDDERHQHKDWLLDWAKTPQHSPHLNLLAFMAIGLGATAPEIETVIPDVSHWSGLPDARLFTAYAALPNSKKEVLLAWVGRDTVLMSQCQQVLALREDIVITDLIDLVVQRSANKGFNRMVFELYCNHPDADPKQMVDWYVDDEFVAGETLAAILPRFCPEPKDVCRAVSVQELFGRDALKKYAIDYFSRRPDDIERLLDVYPDGPVNEMLNVAYKKTETYKNEVARKAAEQ